MTQLTPTITRGWPGALSLPDVLLLPCLSTAPRPLATPGVSKPWPVGQIQPPAAFINNMLLEHSHAYHLHFFTAVPCHGGRVGSFQQKWYGLKSRKHLPSGPIQKKFADPYSRVWQLTPAFWRKEERSGEFLTPYPPRPVLSSP